MARRNLTVQLDEETIARAKVVAAKRGTSISGLVAGQIEEVVAADARYEAARATAMDALDSAARRGKPRWRREDLYAR